MADGIVVGVDGSGDADSAVRWAAREAGLRNVALTLVYALPPQVSPGSPLGVAPVPLPAEYLEALEAEGRELLADAARVAADAAAESVPRIGTELVHGASIPALVDASKEADMLVVGGRGRTALSRLLLGSVSTGAVHHARCPVAVIREDRLPSSGPVVVGVDGSRASQLAVGFAFEEASMRGVDLVAVHSWSDRKEGPRPSVVWSAVQDLTEETLAISLAGWCERYPDVTVHREAVFDRPVEHLLKHSEEAQLLVVGSRGRGGFAGTLLGSVSTALVHAARTPLVVVRGR